MVELSIIVPCWRDRLLVEQTAPGWVRMPHVAEVIIAAVQTGDAVADAAWESVLAARGVQVAWCDKPNRGAQMNAGACLARGSLLLFHHADSELTPAHAFAVHLCLGGARHSQATAAVGGAFYRYFDQRHPRLRWLELLERVRCWLGGPLFGDQSIFVRAEVFRALGGYRAIPLMEDLDFSRRLRRAGRILLLDPPIRTSARRFSRLGSWHATLRNGWFILLFHLGYCPWKLHARYYGLEYTAPH